MNPDKDVLMLFLTSHGQPGLFAVHFPGFPLNHLTPDASQPASTAPASSIA